MTILTSILEALYMAFSMFWEILWPLILGFALSGIIQAVVSHQAMAKALGGDSPKNLALATLFGIASSSCSYAAVALARSILGRELGFPSRWPLSWPSLIWCLSWVFILSFFWAGSLWWRNHI